MKIKIIYNLALASISMVVIGLVGKKKMTMEIKFLTTERMQYKYIKIIKDGAITMPTEAEVNAKIQELKDAEQNAINKKASGKQKLLDLGLTEAEVKALIGV
jgi:hypothetical protein